MFGGAGRTTLVGGRLALTGKDPTAGQFTYKPYDSKTLPISAPIYYFQGSNDPATPAASARYHFGGQRRARRTLLTVPGAAHGPLTWNLRALGTSALFWDAIDRSDSDAFDAAVRASGAGFIQVQTGAPSLTSRRETASMRRDGPERFARE